MALAALHFALSAMLLTLGTQHGVREMQVGGGIILIVAILCSVSTGLIHKNRIALGGWLMIWGIAILIPTLSLFSNGLGWVSLIAIPIVIAWIAQAALQKQNFARAIFIGIVSGVTTLLVDTYTPTHQANMPYLQYVIPVSVTLLMLVAAVLVMRNFRHYRLQTKLLIMFLLVALVPLSLLAFLNYQSTKEALIESANLSLLSAGEQTRNRIDDFFTETENTLQSEANLSIIRTYLTSVAEEQAAQPGNVSVALATLYEKDPAHIRTYAILDRTGNVLLSYPKQRHPPYMGVNKIFENNMRTSVLAGTPYYTPVLFDHNNRPNIYFVAPIYHISKANIPLGLLLVQYDASILQDLIVSQNELAGLDSFGILVDENQLYLAHGKRPDLLYKTVSPLPPEKIESLVSIGRLPDRPPNELASDNTRFSEALESVTPAEPFFAIGTQTVHQVAVTWLNMQIGWRVSFHQPQDAFLAVMRQQTKNIIPLILISAIIVAIASVGATRIISNPITNLTELVEHIAAGNLNIRVPVTTQDEIGRLAATFNVMTSQIRGLLGGLEKQIAERTREIERRAVQLQTAAQVARDVSALQDLSALLERIVNLIHDRFGFYHTGVFLLDEQHEYAILRAANSEEGKEMLRREYRVKAGAAGPVGYATSRGEPRIAEEKDADTRLSATRSEIALPLIVGKKIIGALDVQSQEADAFAESDIAVLQVLADQLAIAIENTRLFTEIQQTVEELQSAYGKTTREAWQKWAEHTEKPIGYRYRGLEVEPAPEKKPETILAIRQGRIITKINADTPDASSTLAIPVQLRGQTFGAIHLRIEGEQIPPDLIKLTERISERLATALESARLYEETRRQAAQEQITGEITARIRETLDVNTMLRTAVEEIGSKLNLHDILIQIDLNEDAPPGEQT